MGKDRSRASPQIPAGEARQRAARRGGAGRGVEGASSWEDCSGASSPAGSESSCASTRGFRATLHGQRPRARPRSAAGQAGEAGATSSDPLPSAGPRLPVRGIFITRSSPNPAARARVSPRRLRSARAAGAAGGGADPRRKR